MKMFFQAGVEYKGKDYFSEPYGFGLFSYDLVSKKVEFCKLFEETDCIALHRKAFLYRNEAWFIPQAGTAIACVNLDDFTMERFEIPYKKRIDKPVIMFSDGIIEADRLYCAPYDIDTLVIIDLRTHVVRTIHDFINPSKENIMSISTDDGKIIFYPLQGERVIYLDTTSEAITIEKRFDVSGEYSEAVWVDHKWYFAPGTDGELCQTGRGREIKISGFNKGNKGYLGHRIVDDKLIFLPFSADSILVVDVNDFSKESLIEIKCNFLLKEHLLVHIPSETRLLFADAANENILEMRLESLELKKYSIFADEKEIKEEIRAKLGTDDRKRLYCKEKIFYESEWKYSLGDFLDYVTS